jgi:hypothetical protein
MLKEEKPDLTPIDHVTKSAAHLSLIEIFIGATVHGLKIPLGGNLLSINQGIFLCRSSRLASRRSTAARWAYEISGVAAILKSLSPAGQKLGPMLSISMQGALFALGNLIAGRGLIGQTLGMILLSLWAFLQPLITLWIVFGSASWLELFSHYQSRQSDEYAFLGVAFATALFVVILLKVIVCAAVPFFLLRFKENDLTALEGAILNKAKRQLSNSDYLSADLSLKPARSPALGAIRDMTRPLFLISFVLMMIFWLARSPSLAGMVWLMLRPLAVAFIIFYLLRSPWFMRALASLGNSVSILRPLHSRAVQARDYIRSMTRSI